MWLYNQTGEVSFSRKLSKNTKIMSILENQSILPILTNSHYRWQMTFALFVWILRSLSLLNQLQMADVLIHFCRFLKQCIFTLQSLYVFISSIIMFQCR